MTGTTFRWSAAVVISVFASLPTAAAESLTVNVRLATEAGPGIDVGHLTLEDSEHGLIIKPTLVGLAFGPHGLHVHEEPDCRPMKMGNKVIPAGMAGGHFDPHKTGRHAGPYGDGHLGDLPNIIAEKDGTAAVPVLAPRLKIADIKNRTLMIHAGIDRYASHKHHHHGKGGSRMYCGLIK